MADMGRCSWRQFGPVVHLELESGVELAEVVQECKNDQPCRGDLIDAAQSRRSLEPSPHHWFGQQRLDARGDIGAVVLQTMKTPSRLELPPGVAGGALSFRPAIG